MDRIYAATNPLPRLPSTKDLNIQYVLLALKYSRDAADAEGAAPDSANQGIGQASAPPGERCGRLNFRAVLRSANDQVDPAIALATVFAVVAGDGVGLAAAHCAKLFAIDTPADQIVHRRLGATL